MVSCEEMPQTIDWIAILKDVIIILLSAIAIFSSYIQHKKTKRSEWIKDFRSIIAKLISTISLQTENNVDYHREIIEQLSLINLYLDEKNRLHSILLDDLKKMKDNFKDFDKKSKNSNEVSDTIVNLILTAKKIIKEENNRIL